MVGATCLPGAAVRLEVSGQMAILRHFLALDGRAHRDTHRQAHCTPTYMLRLIRNHSHRHSDTPIQRTNECAGTRNRLAQSPLSARSTWPGSKPRSTQKHKDTDIQTKRSKQTAYKRPLGGKQWPYRKDYIRIFKLFTLAPGHPPIFPNTQVSWHIPFQTFGKTTGGDFNSSQLPQHACCPVLLVPSLEICRD